MGAIVARSYDTYDTTNVKHENSDHDTSKFHNRS